MKKYTQAELEQLREDYIEQMLEDADWSTLQQIAYEFMQYSTPSAKDEDALLDLIRENAEYLLDSELDSEPDSICQPRDSTDPLQEKLF